MVRKLRPSLYKDRARTIPRDPLTLDQRNSRRLDRPYSSLSPVLIQFP